jgi:hypothetical protein
MTFRDDETIQCERCGRHFTWSYGEQRFYRERNLHRPKRCPKCRVIVNAERDSIQYDRPVMPPHPKPTAPHEKAPLPAERPSIWASSLIRINVLLVLLVTLFIVILIILFGVVF